MNDMNRNARKRPKRRRRRKQSSGGGGGNFHHSINSGKPRRVSSFPKSLRSDGSIDPFALFCALHLGIGDDDNYQPMGVPGVARGFGVDARMVRDSMRDYAMDNDSLRRLSFEMGMARLDTRVVPDGISRTEQARIHWMDFLEQAKDLRDWDAILNVYEEEEETDDEQDELDEAVDEDEQDESATGGDEADESAGEDEAEAEPEPPRSARARHGARRSTRSTKRSEPKSDDEQNEEPPKPSRRRPSTRRRRSAAADDND